MDDQSITSSTVVMGAASEAQNPEALLEQALLAQWERRHGEAEALYQQALAINYDFLSGRVSYAILLAKLGRPGPAETELKRALEIDSTLTVAQLEEARRQEPGDDASLSLCGLLELQHKDWTLAQKWLNLALRYNPDNVCALTWKAQVEAVQGRLNDSESLLQQAMQRQPADPSIHRQYAHLLIEAQRYLEAIEQLDAAVTLDAENMETRQMLDEVQAVLEHQREDAQLVETAHAALQAGQPEQALQPAEAVLARTPTSVEAQALVAESQVAQLRDQIRRHLATAERLAAEEDYEGAATALEQAEQLFPGDEEIQACRETVNEQRTHYLIVRYLKDAQQKEAEGDIEQALALLEMARQLGPESIRVREAHQQFAKRNEARKFLAQARTLAQRDPVAALELVHKAQTVAPELPDIETVKIELQAQAMFAPIPALVAPPSPLAPEPPQSAQEETFVCPHCGKLVRAQSRFCAFCGQPLRCLSCGAQLRPQARFCPKCGKAAR